MQHVPASLQERRGLPACATPRPGHLTPSAAPCASPRTVWSGCVHCALNALRWLAPAPAQTCWRTTKSTWRACLATTRCCPWTRAWRRGRQRSSWPGGQPAAAVPAASNGPFGPLAVCALAPRTGRGARPLLLSAHGPLGADKGSLGRL